MKAHVANILSASRIPGALLLLVIYRPDSASRASVALGLLLVLLLTDLFDGWFARRQNIASEFGYLLDGLGDRAIQVVACLLLLLAGVVPVIIAWALIFREICQYGVRLVDPAWHRSQSLSDRRITQAYMIAVHAALAAELIRTAVASGPPAPLYVAAINLLLTVAACASYSRIIPRLVRAWRDATSE